VSDTEKTSLKQAIDTFNSTFMNGMWAEIRYVSMRNCFDLLDDIVSGSLYYDMLCSGVASVRKKIWWRQQMSISRTIVDSLISIISTCLCIGVSQIPNEELNKKWQIP
jgi:hypothetical protein